MNKTRFWSWVGLLLLVMIFVAIGIFSRVIQDLGFFDNKMTVIAPVVPVPRVYATYQEELFDIVKIDPKAAFIRYREMLTNNPSLFNTCHGIAHQLGHEAFDTLGFQKAMEYQDALCGAGYVHGIIEARFGFLNEHELLNELPTICNFGNEPCYHGLGHGLMVLTELDADKSLKYCDNLPAEWRRNCYDGVWMHIFDLEESGADHADDDAAVMPSDNKVSEHLLRCAHAEDAYKTSCYFYLPRIYAHSTEALFSHFTSLCARAESDYQTVCAAGTGHAVMKYHIADPNNSFHQCTAFFADLITACKEGGAIYYLFASETTGDDLCEIFLTESDRALCRRVKGYREVL